MCVCVFARACARVRTCVQAILLDGGHNAQNPHEPPASVEDAHRARTAKDLLGKARHLWACVYTLQWRYQEAQIYFEPFLPAETGILCGDVLARLGFREEAGQCVVCGVCGVCGVLGVCNVCGVC